MIYSVHLNGNFLDQAGYTGLRFPNWAAAVRAARRLGGVPTWCISEDAAVDPHRWNTGRPPRERRR